MKDKKQFWEDLKSGKFVSLAKESAKGQTINNPQDVFHVMKPVFAENADVEQVYCIYLDSKNRIIATEKTFSGTIDKANIYPREIIKRVLALKSTAIIMVHNHPSGDPEPSQEDRDMTRMVWVALRSIDTTLHDHIVVGDEYYSFNEEGLIHDIKSEFMGFLTKRLFQ